MTNLILIIQAGLQECCLQVMIRVIERYYMVKIMRRICATNIFGGQGVELGMLQMGVCWMNI